MSTSRNSVARQTTISALLNLLEDEDKQVSTLAMEQLLALDREIDALVAEFQESNSPVLRSRMHQVGNILKLRRSRAQFIQSVNEGSCPLWDGLLQINYQYNPRVNFDEVQKTMDELLEQFPRRPNTVSLAAFMRNEGFSYTGEDVFGSDLYLIEDVLHQRIGAPILLSVLARRLGELRGWKSTIVLYRGKHCLVDARQNLIEPAEGWRITSLRGSAKQHPCGDKDIWLTILSQLFLAALMEGTLQAIHRVGSILAKLSGTEFQELPYPLGS